MREVTGVEGVCVRRGPCLSTPSYLKSEWGMGSGGGGGRGGGPLFRQLIATAETEPHTQADYSHVSKRVKNT